MLGESLVETEKIKIERELFYSNIYNIVSGK